MIQIREFIEADYAEARALWEQTEGVGLSSADEPSAVSLFLRRNPGLSFVATTANEIVGTILCGHDGRRGLIHHLVVRPDHRRRGIGRLLLGSGTSALAREKIGKCHLLVFRSNDDGIAFWRQVEATERSELMLFSIETRHDT
ncbi:MAG: GNAT family N-acetyltransferase [Lautropia sp.]